MSDIALQFEYSVNESSSCPQVFFDVVQEFHLLECPERLESPDERDGFSASSFSFLVDGDLRSFSRSIASVEFRGIRVVRSEGG